MTSTKNLPHLSLDAPLVLASASPRRHELLQRLHPDFIIHAADVDEQALIHKAGNITPENLSTMLAQAKAHAIADKYSNHWILAADTIVVQGNTVLGKPVDADDARRILHCLSGTQHRVITGLCLLRTPGLQQWTCSDITQVTMKHMTNQDIDTYIASGEPFGKAGAYAIQETGDAFVQSISGEFDTVVGLPLRRTYDLFQLAHKELSS